MANSRPRLEKIASPAAATKAMFNRSGWPSRSSRPAIGRTAMGSMSARPSCCIPANLFPNTTSISLVQRCSALLFIYRPAGGSHACFQCRTQVSAGLPEGGAGGSAIRPGQIEHGQLDGAGAGKRIGGGLRCAAGDAADHGGAALPELLVLRPDIDHQIVEDGAGPDHQGGRE